MRNTTILGIIALLASVASPGGVEAATITVDTTSDVVADDGQCSLREAISAANTDTASGSTTGECAAGSGTDTITLPAGTYTLTLTGAAEDNNATGDLDIKSNVTIDGALASNTTISGGAIDRVLHIVSGTVEVNDVTITNGAVAFGSGGGAGIENNSTLMLRNSTITGNSAPGLGGGILNDSGTLTIIESTISGNESASGPGGGIDSRNGSTLNIINSTVTGNSAEEEGGGIASSGTTSLSSTTITGNASTFALEGGIAVRGGTANVKNTILAANTAPTGPDCSGTLKSQDFNLIQNTSGCTISGDTAGNVTGQDPILGTLADNGGPTKTHALLSGSPAVNAGSCTDTTGNTITTDQRGTARPSDAICDIGSFEFVSAQGITITVNSTNDADDGTCDATHCSFREAIDTSNMDAATSTIAFNIPTSDPGFNATTTAFTIQPTSALPTITDQVIIDGYTQPGASPNTNGPDLGLNTILNIELDGTNAGSNADGVGITAGSSRVQRLVINRFSGAGIFTSTNGNNKIEGNFIGTNVAGTAGLGNGVGVVLFTSGNNVGGITSAHRNVISNNSEANVALATTGATGNFVQGNFIGTDINGTGALGGGLAGGVQITGSDNTVGGTTAASRNVISGNQGEGIRLLDSSATSNLIQGNYIGTDVTGTTDLGNNFGLLIDNGASNNTIGGTVAGTRNIISGNDIDGIRIEDIGTTGNLVQGNFIGTDFTGASTIGNLDNGIRIFDADSNTIGGTATGARNVISGNTNNGVLIDGGATGNLAVGNFIGTNASGTSAIANSDNGIRLFDASNNTIGGTAAGARNVISGNSNHGVLIDGGSTGIIVQGNFIGTDVTGNSAIANSNSGVRIFDATNTTIGGTATGARNVISGNADVGILIDGGASGNKVQGNFIGTDVTGTADLGNSSNGIHVSDAPNNTIGGSTGITVGGPCTGACNVISGNDFFGVGIQGSAATSNLVQGNYIGTDVTGTADLGNSNHGVRIFDAPGNTIGGTTAAARNVISGNDRDGVGIVGSGSNGNLVLGNRIGTDVTGTVALGNSNGVVVVDAPSNNIGGTTSAARNIISANASFGVVIAGPQATGYLVQGNFIGTDVNGTAGLGNRGDGVLIVEDSPGNTIGGTTAGARNVISGNGDNGVFICCESGTTNNLVQGNFIGTDVTGTSALANTLSGVEIDIDASGNTIGGSTAAANTIAFNLRDGVTFFSGTGNAVLTNSIFSNGALGIDLIPVGVTANDAGDADTGPNNLQNFPVLQSAQIDPGGSLFVEYFVDSAFVNAANPLVVEFFGADADTEEGKTFLGTDKLSGLTTVLANLGSAASLGVSSGDSIVATATDAANNTSEFSQSVSVTSSATAIPGLSQWGLVALAVLMSALIAWRLRRRTMRAQA